MATPTQIANLRVHREIAQLSGRARRPSRKPIPPIAEARGIRMRYFMALRGIVEQIRAAARDTLIAGLPRVFELLPPELRLDAPSDDAFRRLMDQLRDQVEGELGGERSLSLTDRIAREVATFNRQQFSRQMTIAIGIDPFVADPNLSDQVDAFVTDNVSLIKSIGREQLDRVEGIVMRGLRAGSRFDQVRAELEKSFELPRKRAELIAIDQVNKLNGQLTKSRQQQVGINKYRWSTSKDERVRPGHRALDGTIQSWSSPPIENPKTGARGHPREPIRCRCDAIPVVDELLKQLGISPPKK